MGAALALGGAVTAHAASTSSDAPADAQKERAVSAAKSTSTGKHAKPYDKALNAGVSRFSADPTARRDLSYDSDLTGQVTLPVLTLHGFDDPQVFVESEALRRAALRGAGRDGNLVQTFTRESEHSELSKAEYANSLAGRDT